MRLSENAISKSTLSAQTLRCFVKTMRADSVDFDINYMAVLVSAKRLDFEQNVYSRTLGTKGDALSILGQPPLLSLTGYSLSLKKFSTTATPHGTTGFMAHSGEAMFGSSLPSLAVTDEHSCCEDQRKCKEQ